MSDSEQGSGKEGVQGAQTTDKLKTSAFILIGQMLPNTSDYLSILKQA